MKQSTINKIRRIIDNYRNAAKACGIEDGSFDDFLAHEDVFEAVLNYDEMREAQIRESKRFISTLAVSGLVSLGLIAWVVLPLNKAMNSFDFAIFCLCLIDLVICIGGCWREIHRISAASEEVEADV